MKLTVKDDDDNKPTQILNITRGTSSSGSTNNNSNESSVKSKPNQWIQVNGKWQYNDASGNPVKNAWIQNYYLQLDGNMATGWQYIDGYWYYLGEDGSKRINWQLIGGSWYYLDTQGKMQTGWIKDFNGKYYYLNSNGAMAYSTIVDGYKLGANGARIK